MDPLLTRREIAELLRKPESWLRYAERHGLIPYLKIGQQIRYEPSAVAQWLAGCRVAPNVEDRD